MLPRVGNVGVVYGSVTAAFQQWEIPQKQGNGISRSGSDHSGQNLELGMCKIYLICLPSELFGENTQYFSYEAFRGKRISQVSEMAKIWRSVISWCNKTCKFLVYLLNLLSYK